MAGCPAWRGGRDRNPPRGPAQESEHGWGTSWPVLPARVIWPAGAAAAGAAGCPAPGRALGRPRGRAVPGQVSGRRWDGESRLLRSVTSMDDARRRAWQGP